MSQKNTTKQVFLKAAREAGAEVEALNQRPLVMKLTFSDGVAVHTHGTRFPLDSKVASELMIDKDVAVKAQQKAGLPTPRSYLIQESSSSFGKIAHPSHKEYQAISQFVDQVGFPVFIKPNKGSKGRGVFRVDSRKALNNLLPTLVSKRGEYFLLQEACAGTEFRILIVLGKIYLALQRHPLAVTGDGKSEIKHLIEAELKNLRQNGRRIGIKASSQKIVDHLERQELKLSSVLGKGQRIAVLANKNLSDGASPIVCTEEIKEKYAGLCRSIYAKLGIEYCGVDLIEDTRGETIRPYIIELNGSPGFGHFIRSGSRHADMVKDVFLAGFRAAHQLAVQRQEPPVPPKPEADNSLLGLKLENV